MDLTNEQWDVLGPLIPELVRAGTRKLEGRRA